MLRADDKVMFEIYREEGYDRRYRVLYFTELGEHDKEREINRALAGEHVFDGFLDATRMPDARQAIAALLAALANAGAPDPEEIRSRLEPYLVI